VVPAKPPTPPLLDLFDEAEFGVESSNQGQSWFIKEMWLLSRHLLAAFARYTEILVE